MSRILIFSVVIFLNFYRVNLNLNVKGFDRCILECRILNWIRPNLPVFEYKIWIYGISSVGVWFCPVRSISFEFLIDLMPPRCPIILLLSCLRNCKHSRILSQHIITFQLIGRPSFACARRRLIKWTFFVFHFRRRRPSFHLVLLGSCGLWTMALLL